MLTNLKVYKKTKIKYKKRIREKVTNLNKLVVKNLTKLEYEINNYYFSI